MRKIYKLASRYLYKFLEQIVKICPKKYQLAAIYHFRYFLTGTDAELENLEKLVSLKGSSRIALDIGANIGIYAYKMSKLCNKVYAFEINDTLHSFIENYKIKNLQLEKYGLSNICDKATIYLPLNLKGDKLHGWGSLEKRELEGVKDFYTKETEVKTLDSLNIKDIDLIKIDVEGHENKVLQGGINTIKSQRPLIIIETDLNNVETFLINFFKEINYRLLKLHEILSIKEHSSDNWIAIPSELNLPT